MSKFFSKKKTDSTTKRSKSNKALTTQGIGYTKPKVLVIAHNHPEFYPGGAEILAYQLFKEMQNSQYSSIFLAATGRICRTEHQGTSFLSFDGRPDEYLFWGDQFDYFLQSNRTPSALYRDFAKFLKDHKPDIVHFHHTLRMGVEAIKVVKDVLPETVIVYTIHDFVSICNRDGQMIRTKGNELCGQASPARCHECFSDISPALFKTREIFIKTHFDLVDAFVSPSRMLANRFIVWGLPKDKIYIVENGTEETPPANHRPLSRTGKRDRFAFFGQISPYKGTTLLIDAAKKLLDQNFKDFSIHIYGNVSLQSDEFKKSFAEQLADVSANVHFHGRYTSDNIPELIADVDWVVVPSIWWENSPLVIAEAFRHQRPVICSNIGGMAEKVKDHQTGLHFRTGDSSSLADIMYYCINRNGLWEQLNSNIKSPPTIRECAANYIKLYIQCSEARSEPLLMDESMEAV